MRTKRTKTQEQSPLGNNSRASSRTYAKKSYSQKPFSIVDDELEVPLFHRSAISPEYQDFLDNPYEHEEEQKRAAEKQAEEAELYEMTGAKSDAPDIPSEPLFAGERSEYQKSQELAEKESIAESESHPDAEAAADAAAGLRDPDSIITQEELDIALAAQEAELASSARPASAAASSAPWSGDRGSAASNGAQGSGASYGQGPSGQGEWLGQQGSQYGQQNPQYAQQAGGQDGSQAGYGSGAGAGYGAGAEASGSGATAGAGATGQAGEGSSGLHGPRSGFKELSELLSKKIGIDPRELEVSPEDYFIMRRREAEEVRQQVFERQKESYFEFVAGMRERSLIHSECTFENVTIDKFNQQAFEYGRKFLDSLFPNLMPNLYLVCGDLGTGKTVLCHTLANRFLDLCLKSPEHMNRNSDLPFVAVTSMEELRVTRQYLPGEIAADRYKREHRFRELCQVDLLILDGLCGDCQALDLFNQRIFNELLRIRSTNYRPMIITTPIMLQAIHKAVGDSCFEGMKCFNVVSAALLGGSRRPMIFYNGAYLQ